MNNLKVFIVIVIIFINYNCSQDSPVEDNSETIKSELFEAVDTFNKAFQSGDIETLESMIATNYLHTNGTSKAIGKTSWIKYLHQRKKDIEEGRLEVIDYKMDETEIEIYGTTAIITARIAVTSHKDGETKKNQYRVTNLWTKESGNWKRAGFHDGKIN